MLLSNLDIYNLKNYKYYSFDNSLFSLLIGDRLWNWLVTLIPNFISANFLTYMSLISILTGFTCVYYKITYAPFIHVCCVILYMNLDSIDGKYARKTNTSIIFGELLDHVIDSINLTLLCISFSLIHNIYDYNIIYLITTSCQLFFLSEHIKSLQTGVLKMGIIGPTEGLIIYCLGITVNLHFILHSTLFLYTSYTLCIISILNYIMCVIRVNNSYRVDGYHKISYYIIGFMTTIYIVYTVLYYSINIEDIISHNLSLSCLVSEVIVSKMTKRDLKYYIYILIIAPYYSSNISILFSLIYFTFIRSEFHPDVIQI